MASVSYSAASQVRRRSLATAWYLLTVASVCAYLLLWSLNERLVPASAVTLVPALRWVLFAPALLIALAAGYRPHSAMWTQLFFIIVLLLTALPAPNLYNSLLVVARVGCAFLLARCAVFLRPTRAAGLIRWIGLLLVACVGLSLLLYLVKMPAAFGGDDFEEQARVRLMGITSHPGMLGYLAAMLFGWSLSCLLGAKVSPLTRIAAVACAVPAVSCFQLADSRTAYIAAGLSAAGLLAVRLFGGLFRHRLFSNVSAIVLMAAAVALFALPVGEGYWGSSSADSADVYRYSEGIRIALWRSGVDSFLASPLLGNGLGSSVIVKTQFMSQELLYYHSALIDYLAKGGLVAGVAFLVLIFDTCWRVMHGMRAAALATTDRAAVTRAADFALVTLMVTLPFAAVEGALQGIFPTFALLFLAQALAPRLASARASDARQRGTTK